MTASWVCLRNLNLIHLFRWFPDTFSADGSKSMRYQESFEAWEQQKWWWLVLLDDTCITLGITPNNMYLAPPKCQYWTTWLHMFYLIFLPWSILTLPEKSGHTRETSAVPLCSQPPGGELNKNTLFKQAAHARQYPGHEQIIVKSLLPD